jgi:hypothetical protein
MYASWDQGTNPVDVKVDGQPPCRASGDDQPVRLSKPST